MMVAARARPHRLATLLGAAALLLAHASSARAVAPCGARPAESAARAPDRRWSPPLDRRVSLPSRELSLRDALDRLAATARIRISYATELLPLDRRVCDAFDDMATGDVLAALLRGTGVGPVVAGADQVVLAPEPHPADSTPRPARRPTDFLERMVVTGSASEAAARPLAVALDVVSGREIRQSGASSLSSVLDAAVPGIWAWEQSPSSLLARYGSIRGASSFGVSYPKIYVDGIEVANPLLLTQFAPESIERVEVIRGPQGAALYGADAISGVVNIITRHEGVGPGAERVQLLSGFGMARSDFSPLDVITQSHALTLRAGGDTRSAALGVSLASIGDFVPGGFSRRLSANGGLRVIGARASLTATARLFSEEAGAPESPVLGAWSAPRAGAMYGGRTGGGAIHEAYLREISIDSAAPQSVRQYTLGATASFASDARWTHTAVLGVDGYRLANVAFEDGPIPSATDSALRAARGGADRLTARVSSAARFGSDERMAGTITLAGEHSVLREATFATRMPGTSGAAPFENATAWRVTTGLIAQGSLAFREALYLTGGLRLERDAGYTTTRQLAALPMLGAAYVHDVAGGATLKLRAAYGRGIRPPRTASGQAMWMSAERFAPSAALSSEVQAGTEMGADLLFGRGFGLHVTRFDQRASGLIQAVAIPIAMPEDEAPERRHLGYQLQNVGEIANRGWEMQGTARTGRLSLAGTLSLVQSVVEKVTPGYSGDLRAGDRMLEVPARTASLTASWNAPRWYTTWTVTRAADWINYDRLALSQSLGATGDSPGAYPGATLRDYWRRYDGVSHLRATASRDLSPDVALLVAGDNLLDQQRGEPDDVTIVPGRTLSFGVRLRF